MVSKDCVAMILAGGQGSRLGALTKNVAKPAVPFGGKYRIIDFPLSNCVHSGINTVGVLTQYQPLELNRYIGNGNPWDLDRSHGGVYVLPPYQSAKAGEWYKGTANAIYQNLSFLESFKPENVLILSGDHIYKMHYGANDFGKNIIPTMLENGEKMVSFRFEGYWKDVGTIHSLWEANMDLVDQPPKFDLNDRSWSIYSRNMALAPHYVGQNAKITNSTVTEGCFIDGEIKHSVIFGGVELGEGSVVSDSVIMPGAKIGKNVVIEKAVIGADAVIGDGAKVGVNSSDDNKYASKLCTNDLVLIESGAEVGVEEDICKGSMVEA